MPVFFPRHTVELRLDEPRAFRRLSFNLVEMALITGIVARLYRSVALTHGANSWFYLGGSLALGVIFICAMVTLHLANYSPRRWLWRAPLFAFVEVVGEMTTSLFLIWANHEPEGATRAEFHDWWGLAGNAVWTRELAICGWALLLGVIVTPVRGYISRPGYPIQRN